MDKGAEVGLTFESAPIQTLYYVAMIWKMFWKWILLFAAAGLVIPALLLLRFYVFGATFGTWEFRLWPSSLMFMALDAPGTPWSTVAFIYALAFVENALLYVLIGILAWLIFYLVRQSRR